MLTVAHWKAAHLYLRKLTSPRISRFPAAGMKQKVLCDLGVALVNAGSIFPSIKHM
jgi:hypothetical protein